MASPATPSTVDDTFRFVKLQRREDDLVTFEHRRTL